MDPQSNNVENLEIPNVVRHLKTVHNILEETLSILFERLEPVRATVPSDSKEDANKKIAYVCPLSEEIAVQIQRIEGMIVDVQVCLNELQV